MILFAAFGPEADYQNTTVTLVFSPTATSFRVPVFIIDDSYLENDEPFRTVVNLTTADPSINITPNSATITILNDDSESYFFTVCNTQDVMKYLIFASIHADVIIGFVQSDYTVSENSGILSIPVRIRGPNILRRSVTFDVTTQDGSAQGIRFSCMHCSCTCSACNCRWLSCLCFQLDRTTTQLLPLWFSAARLENSF